MRILNFGSLNIDLVYQVDHIARPGETIASSSHHTFAGGKGANQSAALAAAGAEVYHAGQVGSEGRWLIDKLAALGVHMEYTEIGEAPTGHAIIQVDKAGENSIVLYPGANTQISRTSIDSVLSDFDRGDILLLQNEINHIPYLVKEAAKHGLHTCFNPAPFSHEILDYPLETIDTLIVNATEAAGLTGLSAQDQLLAALAARYPRSRIILTLGAEGAHYLSAGEFFYLPAEPVHAVDTTGAGDTFIGYLLHGIMAQMAPRDAMTRAGKAAALCVMRPGAIDSIPLASEIT